jgi:hypothetical protein
MKKQIQSVIDGQVQPSRTAINCLQEHFEHFLYVSGGFFAEYALGH